MAALNAVCMLAKVLQSSDPSQLAILHLLAADNGQHARSGQDVDYINHGQIEHKRAVGDSAPIFQVFETFEQFMESFPSESAFVIADPNQDANSTSSANLVPGASETK